MEEQIRRYYGDIMARCSSDTVSIRKLNLSGNNRDVDNWRKFYTLEKVS